MYGIRMFNDKNVTYIYNNEVVLLKEEKKCTEILFRIDRGCCWIRFFIK